MNETITFTRQEIISLLKQIREIPISLNRIGSAASVMPENQWKEATVEYVIESELIERLSECRYLLESKFTGESLGEDELTELDKELQDIEYWNLQKYKNKHGL